MPRAVQTAIDAFPLAPFLASLATLGIRPTLDDYQRISRVLRSGGRWDLERLRWVLAALLVREPEREAAFHRRFEEFFSLNSDAEAAFAEVDIERILEELRGLGQEPDTQPKRQGPHREPHVSKAQPDWRIRRLWLGIGGSLFFGLVVTITVLLSLFPPTTEQEESTPQSENQPPVEEDPRPSRQRIYPNVPVVKAIIPIPNPEAGRWQAPAGIASLLLLITLVYGAWLWRARKPPFDLAPPWHAELPRHFRPGTIGGPPLPRLDKDTLDHLADSLGYFQSEQPGKTLDIPASIAATTDQGGLPALRFCRRRQVREVLILEDAFAEARDWNPIAGELARGLARRGIPVLHGFFQGVPEAFRTTDGRGVRLEDLEDDRRAYLLLIFSDGKGLRSKRDRFILEDLARWPRVAWMELREPRAWDPSTALPARAGIPVHPANAEGLLQVMRRLMTERGAQDDLGQEPRTWHGVPARGSGTPLSVHLERRLGDALPWAQACAMMVPPISVGLAEALRRRFHPTLPPERLERLYTLPGVTCSSASLHFSPSLLAILRHSFAQRRSEEEQQAVLEFLLEKIRETEPEDKKSPAHLAWEWRLERVRLELEPDRALRRLAELAGSPLGDSIRAELAPTAIVDGKSPDAADDPVIPLRRKPETRLGLKRLLALAKNCGIPKREAYPIAKGHRAALTLLTLGSLGIFSYALWERLAADRPAINLALKRDKLAQIEASLEMHTPDGWKPIAQPSGESYPSWTVKPDSEYRLVLLSGDQAEPHPLGVTRDSQEIVLDQKDRARDCREVEPSEIRLTLERCPTAAGKEGEAITLPTWRETLGPQAPEGRLLSVGLEIRTDETENPLLKRLSNTLLESRAADRLYRLFPAADGTLHVDKALVRIAADLGPWAKQTQLLLWAVGENADRIALPDSFPVGRTLRLGQGEDSTWAEPLLMRLDSKKETAIAEKEILAAVKAGKIYGVAPPIVIPTLAAAVPSQDGENALTPGRVFRDPMKDGSEGPEMVVIPTGTFRMGDLQGGGGSNEQPVQKITIEKPFALGKYEVTNAEYVQFLNAVGRRGTQKEPWFETKAEDDIGHILGEIGDFRVEAGFEDHPVVNVSWYGARAYAEWLSAQTGHPYRLPTEAEWEYAARAETETKYWWGNEASHERANYSGTEGRDRWEGTSLKDAFPANSFGLHDTAGNVWEWTCSAYENEYAGQEKQCISNNHAGRRSLRGGSWYSGPRRVRSASRYRYWHTGRSSYVGFRLARLL